jgi:hypothetical protein
MWLIRQPSGKACASDDPAFPVQNDDKRRGSNAFRALRGLLVRVQLSDLSTARTRGTPHAFDSETPLIFCGEGETGLFKAEAFFSRDGRLIKRRRTQLRVYNARPIAVAADSVVSGGERNEKDYANHGASTRHTGIEPVFGANR